MPDSHYLVPQVSLLPSEDSDKVVAKFGLKKELLPFIKVTDPMLAEIKEAKAGDVVKIARKSPFVKEGVEFYRLVIE